MIHYALCFSASVVHAVAFFCVSELYTMQELQQGWRQAVAHGRGVHDQSLVTKKEAVLEVVWCCSMVHVFLLNSDLSVLYIAKGGMLGKI